MFLCRKVNVSSSGCHPGYDCTPTCTAFLICVVAIWILWNNEPLFGQAKGEEGGVVGRDLSAVFHA